jgi:hypothetical protein
MSNDLFKKYKDKSVFEDPKSIQECFNYFDKDWYVCIKQNHNLNLKFLF